MKVFFASVFSKMELALIAEDAVKERSLRRRFLTCTFVAAAYASILVFLLK